VAAFRDWEQFTGERFASLKNTHQPTLVIHDVQDEMIPVRNPYWLSENLPNAVLLTYPDSGHGSLFQFHESFTRQSAAFLVSASPFDQVGASSQCLDWSSEYGRIREIHLRSQLFCRAETLRREGLEQSRPDAVYVDHGAVVRKATPPELSALSSGIRSS
jgi:hypothetical protein